jgi:hypothetical protein
VDFVCAAEGGELQAASDVSEACWAGREDLERFGLRPDTLRVIEKAFQATEAVRGK